MLREWGVEGDIVLQTDAAAALGILGRRGHGRIRHIHTNDLWLQDKVAEKCIVLEKIPGTENDADLGTKPLQESAIQIILWRMCHRVL